MNKDVSRMSHPVLLLKKHLVNIYARIDKLDPDLSEFMERMADDIDNLGREIDNLEREKLSVKEFREFVDEFKKALVEGLPSPDEPAKEEPEKQPVEMTIQATASGSQQQQTEETEEIQKEEKKRKLWLF